MRSMTKMGNCAFAAVSVATASMLVLGCASLWEEFGGARTRTGTSSSLVEFLYPDGEVPPDFIESIPNLQLPLRVGLAFVPGSQAQTQGLSEEHKSELLEKVRASFVEHDFIADIEIIPDTYMRTRGGFESVGQVARLYGVDVMALVSYDQVGYVGENWKSVTYWTIVGMYVIKGSEHEVQTFVDTAVFDVASRKLLFRAPGHSGVTGSASAVSHSEKVRRARESGFDQAVDQMIPNLEAELAGFRRRVEAKQEAVKVTYREGYTGSGAAGAGLVLALLVLAAARQRKIA